MFIVDIASNECVPGGCVSAEGKFESGDDEYVVFSRLDISTTRLHDPKPVSQALTGNLSSRLLKAALVLALSPLLSACPRPGLKGSGGAAPPATSPTVQLTIKVKAARGAPDDFGLVPGNAIAGAKVEVESSAESGGPKYAATTDESGRAVVMVQSGSYRITAGKGTYDPYCWWYSGTDVEVVDEPVTVKIYDLWVLCE